MNDAEALLRVEGLSKHFSSRRGLLGRREVLRAVSDVDLEVRRGETLALVGGSGSGKSTLARMLVGLETPTAGKVWFKGVEMGSLRGPALRAHRRRMAIVFQNPYRSLNPRMSVGRALAEVVSFWRTVEPGQTRAEVERLLSSVGLPPEHARRYPHELSGGERQRVAIARALSVRPELLVADEAVSSLDVSVAAEVLNLLMRLRRELDLSCVFVTHDLHVARVIADRIAVMRLGELVEHGTPEELFASPSHPYTKTLLTSQLSLPR